MVYNKTTIPTVPTSDVTLPSFKHLNFLRSHLILIPFEKKKEHYYSKINVIKDLKIKKFMDHLMLLPSRKQPNAIAVSYNQTFDVFCFSPHYPMSIYRALNEN